MWSKIRIENRKPKFRVSSESEIQIGIPFEEFWGRLSWRSYCSIYYSKYWEYRYNDKITLALVELFKR